MLARRPLFAFVHSMAAQLRAPSRWPPISDRSACLSLFDAFARTPLRSSCATRRSMTSSDPTELDSNDLEQLLEPHGDPRLAPGFLRKLGRLLHEGRYRGQQVDIQPDGFVRVQQILALRPFHQYDEESFKEFVELNPKKTFQMRCELYEESGDEEWFVRLAKGKMNILMPGLDRGNKKIPLAQAFRRKLGRLLREGGYQDQQVDMQPDGFVRVRQILALRPFHKYDEESFKEFVELGIRKRFQMRRELYKESGEKEWFVRLAKGEMTMPIPGVDRGNKKIKRVRSLPLEMQCTLTLEDWSFFRHHGLVKGTDNLIRLHAVRDNAFDIDYRPDGSKVLVTIDMHAAFYAGIPFYIAKNDDFVTEGDINGVLPPIYFKKAVKVEYECEPIIRQADCPLRLELSSLYIQSEQPDARSTIVHS